MMKINTKLAALGLLFPVLLAATGCDQPGASSESGVRSGDALERVNKTGVLLWGADVIGGIPYVYEDPAAPGTYIGFEMDIAQAIGKRLGVEQRMVIRAWDTLIPELQRGSFDIAMNGIEDTSERSDFILFSKPYYVYAQQITVRKEQEGINALSDLDGKIVATLSGTAAEDLLREQPGVHLRIHPEIIYSYGDLEAGKVDAVVLDTPIAAAYGATNPKFKNVGDPFAPGRYVIALRKEDERLQAAIDEALGEMKASGELKAIYEKWGIMSPEQQEIGVR
jgi:polar amino acid transport system substrate-binding protein